jgi:hypothetical protein
MNSLVLDWLIVEGFQDIAEKFVESTGMEGKSCVIMFLRVHHECPGTPHQQISLRAKSRMPHEHFFYKLTCF